MLVGQPAPTFPRRIATHPLPTRHLAALVQRAVPVLRYLETIIHPRWATPIEATKRVVGAVVATLAVVVASVPIPLSSIAPALVIALIALAYLEEDGLLLSVALTAAGLGIGSRGGRHLADRAWRGVDHTALVITRAGWLRRERPEPAKRHVLQEIPRSGPNSQSNRRTITIKPSTPPSPRPPYRLYP